MTASRVRRLMKSGISSFIASEKREEQPHPLRVKEYTYLREGDFGLSSRNVAYFILGHLLFIVGWSKMFYTLFYTDYQYKYHNLLWIYGVGIFGAFGVTAGAHRLWAHKSYEAKLPLRIYLMIAHCVAGQNCLYLWCRDHRVHHKFSDTDADPHNTRRGFFFSHCGWLLRKKHPELKRKAQSLDFSDLLEDPVVKFQDDYYVLLYVIFSMCLPSIVPIVCWNENIFTSVLYSYAVRYINTLHDTWFVNSASHMFGDKPYNPNIEPVQNVWVSFGGMGEGFHNYHHTYPWDYRAHETGSYLNTTKAFIDIMAYLGQVRSLKKVDQQVVEKRKKILK